MLNSQFLRRHFPLDCLENLTGAYGRGADWPEQVAFPEMRIKGLAWTGDKLRGKLLKALKLGGPHS